MPPDPLRTVAQVADALASATSLRDACGAATERLNDDLSSRFTFLARPSQDSGVAELVAAKGLHAADYRRLESRLPKSSLWRILSAATPFVIDDLGHDPVLNFLAFATHTRMLAAVPIKSGSRAEGVLAVGFSTGARSEEARTLRIMETVASLIARSLQLDQTVVSENALLAAENRRLRMELKERYDLGNLIGNSGGMRQAFDRLRQVARSNAPVLLRGESGSGKDVFANAIRFNSLRSKRPFVKVDLNSVPSAQVWESLDDTLARAEAGTLFIDEIAAAAPELQSRMSELVSATKAASRDHPADHNVRFIFSTGRDIESMTSEGLFDDALKRELAGHTIFLPPLRERRSDTLLLAEHFLEKFALDHKKSILRISTPAIDMLSAYHFPGNVRELENVIEHAVGVCDSNVIHGHHLPATLQTAELSGTETRVTLESAVATFERDLIQDALKSTRGNVAKAARMLDSTERILGYKIKKYDLDPRRFRSWR